MLSLGQLYTDANNDDDNNTNDDDNDTRDKSWLHRLIGMYAKWAKKHTLTKNSTFRGKQKCDDEIKAQKSTLYF